MSVCKSVDKKIFVATIIFMDAEKRSRGRPFKPDEDRRTAELRIRLTDDERELLDAAADGKTSTWARNILLRAAKRDSRS